MFLVLSREKICSYVVTLGVIGVLFTISAVFPKDAIETSGRNTYNETNVAENG